MIDTISEQYAEITRLRAENDRLRERIASFHNHDLGEIQDRIDQAFREWMPKVREANRHALRQTD